MPYIITYLVLGLMVVIGMTITMRPLNKDNNWWKWVLWFLVTYPLWFIWCAYAVYVQEREWRSRQRCVWCNEVVDRRNLKSLQQHYKSCKKHPALNEIMRLRKQLEQTRWIPVSERLPDAMVSHKGIKHDLSDLVHVFPRPTMDRAVWYDWDLEKWSCSAEVKVTHWVPLPQPPEVK